MFQKGQRVRIFAEVRGTHSVNKRTMTRYKLPESEKGLVLGYSFIRTGKIQGGNLDPFDYYPPHLEDITDNKVWVVMLYRNSNRYLKPVRVLEKDIERITDNA